MHRSPAAILNRPISSDVDTNVHKHRDPNTLSNYNVWKCKHTTAELQLDFKAKKVIGSVKYDMHRLAKGVKEIVLDTRSVNSSSLYLEPFIKSLFRMKYVLLLQ